MRFFAPKRFALLDRLAPNRTDYFGNTVRRFMRWWGWSTRWRSRHSRDQVSSVWHTLFQSARHCIVFAPPTAQVAPALLVINLGLSPRQYRLALHHSEVTLRLSALRAGHGHYPLLPEPDPQAMCNWIRRIALIRPQKWWRTYYHFCRPHLSLRLRLGVSQLRRGKQTHVVIRRAPRATGLTDHIWSVEGFLAFPWVRDLTDGAVRSLAEKREQRQLSMQTSAR